MFTREFWKATAERAVRAGAIVASFAWGTTAATEVGQLVGPLEATAVGFLWGAVGSVLLSLAGSQVGVKGSPSFTDNERVL